MLRLHLYDYEISSRIFRGALLVIFKKNISPSILVKLVRVLLLLYISGNETKHPSKAHLKPLHNIGKNVHKFTHNLHGIKITMVESFP